MITFLRNRSLSCLGVAGLALVALSGCGGSGSDEGGYAPDSLNGYVLQLNMINPTSGTAPGLVNVYSNNGTMAASDGQTYTAQVTYTRTGANTAIVSVGFYTPEDPGTATTETSELTASMEFYEIQGSTIMGNMTEWTYQLRTAGVEDPTSEGQGSSGEVKLIPLN